MKPHSWMNYGTQKKCTRCGAIRSQESVKIDGVWKTKSYFFDSHGNRHETSPPCLTYEVIDVVTVDEIKSALEKKFDTEMLLFSKRYRNEQFKLIYHPASKEFRIYVDGVFVAFSPKIETIVENFNLQFE